MLKTSVADASFPIIIFPENSNLLCKGKNQSLCDLPPDFYCLDLAALLT